MKTIKQLLRQPQKTIFGIILIALAVAVLCTSIGQAFAAKKMFEEMEYTFVTTALPTMKHQMKPVSYEWNGVIHSYYVAGRELPEEVDDWILSVEEAYPDLVKTLSSPGLAAAYIEGLSLSNRTQAMDGFYTATDDEFDAFTLWPSYPEMPGTLAMLEITIEKIGAPRPYPEPDPVWDRPMESGNLIAVPIKGRILDPIGVQDGYHDPTGYTAHLTLKLPSLEAFEKLDLKPGERYLVFGTNYEDLDWHIRCFLSEETNYGNLLDELEEDRLKVYDFYREKEEYKGPGGHNIGLSGVYHGDTASWEINDYDIECMKSISLTLEDKSMMPGFDFVEDPEGGHYVQNWDRFEIAEDGTKTSISQEEYEKRYAMPTIVHLTGTAEEFLASPEGALWKETLDATRINHSAVPVLAVDRLGYIGSFAKEKTRIIDGRDFTQEELETGAKVCIIPEGMAEINGLKVGDTIAPNFYDPDKSNPYQQEFPESGYGAVNPVPWIYGRTTPAAQPEEYTIVGLYRQKGAWSFDLHSFTPNTMFVPKNAVTSHMEFSNQGVFRTVVLKNGAVPQFREYVDMAGYEGLFEFYDHGYTQVAGNLQNYQGVARSAIRIGCVIYGIIVLIFMLLYPMQQKKNVIIMDSLGAERGGKIRHVVLNTLGIFVPGTVIGALTGALLWEKVTAAMSSETLELALPLNAVIAVALLQLLTAAVVVTLIALPVTSPRDLGNRK